MPSLSVNTNVLGNRNAKHLLRRLTLDYRKETIDSFANLTPSQAFALLEQIPTQKIAEPNDPQPTSSPDGYWTLSSELPNSFAGQGRKRIAVSGWYWYNGLNEVSLKHKMTFFLHTCFTVSKDGGVGAATYFYDHIRLLEYYSLGNIKDLAKKITLDHAMLFYLDNHTNTATNPNENYAREFLELFTILKGPQQGVGNYTNYTEEDVQAAAKVFTGFRNQNDRSIIDSDTGIPKGYILTNRHDKNDKQFSAAFGNTIIKGGKTEQEIEQELDDFVEMVFAQDATAISYARKLYRFFVKSEWGAEVENDIIVPLAAELKANNYEILPTLKTLFTSQHFYDLDDSDSSDNIVGAIVKNPLQLFTEIVSLFKLPIADVSKEENLLQFYLYFFQRFVHNSCFASAGLNFFSPDSVAGYPAVYQSPDFDRQWFSSTSIIARYKYIQSLILGKNLISSGSFDAKIDTVLWVKNHISNPLDSDVLISEMAELLYPELIPQERKDYFSTFLLDTFDKSYWFLEWEKYTQTSDDTTVKIRLDELFIAMVNAAEFQLM